MNCPKNYFEYQLLDPQNRDQKHRFTNAFTTMWMDLEMIIASEVRDKNKHHMI